jgi:hypothetical protein
MRMAALGATYPWSGSKRGWPLLLLNFVSRDV